MKLIKRMTVNFTVLLIVAASQTFQEVQHATETEGEVRGVIENSINTTLNKIIANLTDPIIVATKTFNFGEGESLSGSFNVSSLRISGVKDFVAKEIEVHLESQKINMRIALPELSIHFKYWADMVILDLVPLYGQGRMGINFDGVEVEVQATGGSEENVKVRDIVLLFSLNETTFDLKGLINNPEYSALISNAVTDNFANFVNHNAEIISETISPILETIINSILEPTSQVIRIRDSTVWINT